MTADDGKSKDYLAYVRSMVAERKERLAVIDRERDAILGDLAGWQEIIALVAAKIGLAAPGENEPEQTSAGTAEPKRVGELGPGRSNGERRPSIDRNLPGIEEVAIEEHGYDFSMMTHGQAATVALRKIGRAATAAEIRDELASMGHTINDDPKLAANIFYNSMGRLGDIFRKNDGGRWDIIDTAVADNFINR